MPVPELPTTPAGTQTTASSADAQHLLGHVNLMVDTLIANANLEDLRAIVRGMLTTSPPSTAQAFTAAARQRFLRVDAAAMPDMSGMFVTETGSDETASATEKLGEILKRVRTLYGAGMGLASLRILTGVVRATVGVRWGSDEGMEGVLASIDADISQAIQSSKEEISGGRVSDVQEAREIVQELRSVVGESQVDVRKWDGVFPFERAAGSLEYWRV